MKSKRYGVNIGSSSILVIFVVVCLVSFAALSIVSANSDYRLTQKMADRQTLYYQACNDAYQTLSDIDATLCALYNSGITQEEYYAQVGYEKSYAYPVSDIQSLQVVIQINYPNDDMEPFYEIQKWRIITTGTLDYDESLPVAP